MRPLKVKQYHFTSWPDHGVPEYATSMLSFHKRVISQHKTSQGTNTSTLQVCGSMCAGSDVMADTI